MPLRERPVTRRDAERARAAGARVARAEAGWWFCALLKVRCRCGRGRTPAEAILDALR